MRRRYGRLSQYPVARLSLQHWSQLRPHQLGRVQVRARCNRFGRSRREERKASVKLRERPMGLLDVLTGMMNGPRGGARSQGRGGPSPLTLGLFALLAYKAFKGNQPNAAPPAQYPPTQYPPSRYPQNQAPAAPAGGGLGDWLRGALGGALTGVAAGPIISGGLGELMRQFQQNGHGGAARSWIALALIRAFQKAIWRERPASTPSISCPGKRDCARSGAAPAERGAPRFRRQPDAGRPHSQRRRSGAVGVTRSNAI